jgi:hypothetical protein
LAASLSYRCDAPTLLDLIEEPFNEVAGAVEVRAEADRLFAVPLRWNIPPRAPLSNKRPDPVRVTATVRQQQGLRTKSAQEPRAEAVVVCLAGREAKLHRQALAVYDSVDFGAEPTAPPPHLLGSVAGDAGSMLVHTHDRGVYHLSGRIMGGTEPDHKPVPDASPPPANETTVAGHVGAVALWQIAPRRAGSQDPEDAVEDAPVSSTRGMPRGLLGRIGWMICHSLSVRA